MVDEWGPWIEHDGRGCPCRGMWVQMVHRVPYGDFTSETVAGSEFDGTEAITGSSWHWAVVQADWYPVIRYRIRRPRALLNLIEMVENLPAPSKQREDA